MNGVRGSGGGWKAEKFYVSQDSSIAEGAAMHEEPSPYKFNEYWPERFFLLARREK